MMRSLVDEHPLLLATGGYLWLLYGAATTIWGDRAEREFEWRDTSMFRWFLRPPWPLDDLDRFVFAQKIGAWIFLVAGTIYYLAFVWRRFLGPVSLTS